MPEDRPLLSICIPTYNRSVFLAELLESLLPELTGETRVELLISDNASPDDTQTMIERMVERGLRLRSLRNAENLGADANFLHLLDLARGRYVWVLGDDDLIAPGAIGQLLALLERDEYDLVYLSSIGFSGEDRPVRKRDVLGRFAEVVTDGEFFMRKVGPHITLVSANIVNKDRLMATPHPPLTELIDSVLLQLGWLLPVIHRRCRILYVWERVLFHRSFNSGGWGICEVFGVRLNAIARRYFAREPVLADHLMNGVLRLWLPDHIMQMRTGVATTMEAEDFSRTLGPVFRRNWRYWAFVYTVANAPLPVAVAVHGFNRALNRGARLVSGVLRHVFRRGPQLRP